MKSIKYVALTLATVLVGQLSSQAAEAPADIQFVRPLGMGGAFTAIADDQNIFNYNPAGMVQRTGGQFTLLEIAAGASSDTKDAYDFIKNNKDKLNQDFNNLPANEQAAIIDEITNHISKLDPRIYVAADVASYVSGPKFFGMPLHVGYGLFGAEDFSFRVDQAAGVPNISYASNADAILPLALAKRFETRIGKLGFGVTGKYIRRIQISQQRVSVLTLDDIKTPPTVQGTGLGADLGLLYQPTNRMNFGLMMQDVGGTKMKFDAVNAKNGYPGVDAHNGTIRPRVNMGLALMPKKILWLIPTGERWTFAADIKDIFQSEDHVIFQNGINKIVGENFGTHAHLGAEYRWWFFRFRGGASEGYPTLGLGLDLPVIKLDYAYYSRELGRLAGDRQQTNHIISLSLRFGANYTESRERIVKNKEEKSNMRDTAMPDTGAAVESSSVPNAAPAKSSEPKVDEKKVKDKSSKKKDAEEKPSPPAEAVPQ